MEEGVAEVKKEDQGSKESKKINNFRDELQRPTMKTEDSKAKGGQEDEFVYKRIER